MVGRVGISRKKYLQVKYKPLAKLTISELLHIDAHHHGHCCTYYGIEDQRLWQVIAKTLRTERYE